LNIKKKNMKKSQQELIDSLKVLADACGAVVTSVNKYITADKSWLEDSPRRNISLGELADRVADEGLKKFNERLHKKSLHDQITEGGWPIVYAKAGGDFDFQILHSRSIAEKNVDKTLAYSRLLMLSKVLNEGKDKTEESFTVSLVDDKLRPCGCMRKWNVFPVEFNTTEDCRFSWKFAEKEWKTFYNQS
jgi:hypothetical protein